MSSKKYKILLITLVGFLFINYICLIITFSFSFKLNGKKYEEVSYKENYKEKGATADLLGINLSKKIKIKGKVNNKKIGENKIKYTYKFLFWNIELERKIVIKDLDAPSIELIGEEEVTICPTQNYEELGFTANDELEGDLTSKVKIKEEDDKIKYSVKDSSGNKTEKIRTINKEDKEKPTISLVGGNTISVRQNDLYRERGYSATDVCDGDLTQKVEVKGSVDTSVIKTYIIEYTVTDSSGNRETVQRQVVVKEPDPSDKLPGVIYLTFDDGPSNTSSTSKILDILKEEGVKATFFVTGSGPDDLIRREYAEGHAIGLHTNSHKYASIYSSVEQYFMDLEIVQTRVKNLIGEDVKILRFPGGSNNTVSNQYNFGIMGVLKQEVTNRGYAYFDWNVDSNDAGRCAGGKNRKDCVYDYVTSNLKKQRANIVLMHDIKDYTANALRDIITYGKNHGYTFEALNTSSPQVHL